MHTTVVLYAPSTLTRIFRPRRYAARFAILLVSSLALILGCGRDHPEMVPVRGKVTLDGGPWPKPGVVNFTPVEPGAGLPRKPGSGHFNTDGTFTVSTGEFPGLIPGDYRITVTCWDREPGDNDPGCSYTPERFTLPAESGLELKIPPGTDGPLVWEKDLPRARPAAAGNMNNPG